MGCQNQESGNGRFPLNSLYAVVGSRFEVFRFVGSVHFLVGLHQTNDFFRKPVPIGFVKYQKVITQFYGLVSLCNKPEALGVPPV